MRMTTKLPIMEEFLTIQGEGANAGKVAYFIRLAGCDVGCSWCDVKESWDKSLHPEKTVSEIVQKAKESGAPNVVVTGGEPTLYDLSELTSALKNEGLNTWIETSGTNLITGTWDWICLSPKKFKQPLIESLVLAHELKVIVLNKSDLIWAETFLPKLSSTCDLFMQPEWSKKEKASELIIEYLKKNPEWRVSLQTHKYLDIP
ncbi:MAG: 7-carboxy-7-deazaguanine synthase [Salibacteraceae bacterium]|jgi:7-carboxy-7-deazaguanine synthase